MRGVGSGSGGRGGRRRLLAACLLALAVGAPGFATARAEDGADDERPAASCEPEVWHFAKGDARRTVDVTDLAEVVREAVLARMRSDGYARVAGPAPGRDLEADARALVAHGGRFPGAAPEGGGAEGVLLGAVVRLETRGEAAWLRVLEAPAGSLARGLGLGRGDRILDLDGRTPSAGLLGRLREVELRPGQLTLRVLRSEGRTGTWSLTFAAGPAPASR